VKRFACALALPLLAGFALALCLAPASAQKPGGILRMFTIDSPASMSPLEEATVYSQGPTMGIFNNLIMFDQHTKLDRIEAIVPDLAESWAWSEDGKDLTFKLRHGVKWHDGKPFTAADVVCTWDLILEKSPEKLRVNPRKSSYDNLDRVEANGDYEVTFYLKRPQPAFPTLLGGGFSAVYPCHVPPAQMRQRPIGTGPFKFAEFRPNEVIKVARNPDYWKPSLPYLDGIEYPVVKNLSTAILGFASGQFDMTFPNSLSMPLLKDAQSQVPDANCEIAPDGGVNRHLLIHRDKPPFDNPELRRAMALTIDRKAFVDIITEGQGDIGGVLQPAPGGIWSMPPEELAKLPGYDPDIGKNRSEARAIMQRLGYGPDKRLAVKVTTRDIPGYRDPAVILIDQLKQIYIDGELDVVDTPNYFPKIRRKDFTIALNLQTSGPDPDPLLHVFYGCGSSLNWDGYCNPEIDKLIDQQSLEADQGKRKQLLWTIERRLAEEVARPIIFYTRGATCWRPYVKNVTVKLNSLYSGNRREDWWLDK